MQSIYQTKSDAWHEWRPPARPWQHFQYNDCSPLLSEVIVRIARPELGKIVLEVAEEKFDGREFGRRSLMNAVEERMRELGKWTQSDDSTSGSRGLKSTGLANIDWCITDLKKKRRLLNVERDKWKLPSKSR